MFGFGRPSAEKMVINLLALQLEPIGMHSSEAVRYATKLVDEVLSEMRPRGVDPFKSTQGNDYVDNAEFMTPRLATGLTVEDIKFYWNRALLIIFCEMKMRELINFIIVDAARQQGRDTSAASMQYKRTFPRYGDPSQFDPSEKFNIGLGKQDADIFPEFATRIDAWRKKTLDGEVEKLISKHGTLNAALRQQISSGVL